MGVHPTSASAFEKELWKRLEFQNRYMRVNLWSRISGKWDTAEVHFVNLPFDIVEASLGGGAEVENNRLTVFIRGFHPTDVNAAAPGKVKLEVLVSVFNKRLPLRGKTADPMKMVEYLAGYLNKLAKEIQPNYTHTKV